MQDVQWLANFGFAAVVAGYVLVRLEPALKDLNKSVNLLAIVVAKTNGVDYEEVKRDFMNGA
ncbi:MAG: YvrJ family protein [Firmicutes bacterium]|nr:YvrJ family protein [Bacillota bacterium]MTI83425.1 YvrJ family protein [Bacillota bacterium]